MSATELWLAVRRGWWMVLGVPLVAAIATAVVPPEHPLVFQVHSSLALDVPTDLVVPTSDAGAAKVGETLVDDISRMISGDVFAAAVASRLGTGRERKAAPAPGEITSSLSATDRHRVLDITVTRSVAPNDDPQVPVTEYADEIRAVTPALTAIADAAAEELTKNGDRWFALLGAGGARLTVVDSPRGGLMPPTLRQRLEVPLRLLAAAALGFALALGLWIRDPRIRSRADAAAATGSPILGTIG